MPTSIIVGSGPAAAAVTLALIGISDEQVTVIDPGNRLDDQTRSVLALLSDQGTEDWSENDIRRVSEQPRQLASDSIPQKRSYGSDYPFANVGQLDGLEVTGRTNASAVSGAYGGFSNVWGAQVMPFTPATFADWPVSFDELEPHYRAVLRHIPYSGEVDDLVEWFPLISSADPLPPLAPRTQLVLDAYRRRRQRVRAHGVIVGRARLAFSGQACDPCGLCMTGCPRSLIYSASQSFDRFRQNPRMQYKPGLLAHRVSQSAASAVVDARDLASGQLVRLEADRVFLAAGAVGTTRLVLASKQIYDRPVVFQEAGQFVLPVLSKTPTPDPRQRNDFVLNQFNVVVALDDVGKNISQIHFYPYNSAFFEALPKALQATMAEPAARAIIKRISVGLGYLPSWASPGFEITARRPSSSWELPPVMVAPRGFNASRARRADDLPMLTSVLQKLRRVAPYLDLWPVASKTLWSGAGKSYHFGGSFPHSKAPSDGKFATDVLGRLPGWDRVHLVDGSVFPTVPATTFTLTVMANAHRIATRAAARDR
ncbi:MAG: GMC oxidoreductase [Acidimicrobiales bacterium]